MTKRFSILERAAAASAGAGAALAGGGIERAAALDIAPGTSGDDGATPIRPVAEPAPRPGLVERASAAAALPRPRPQSYAEAQSTQETLRIAPARPAPARTGRRADIDFAALATRGYLTPDTGGSLLAEEFRIVKRQLLANVAARGEGLTRNSNIILVGSALQGEGKTFCAINLAMSIAAERDFTVLLIDADVTKPEILPRLGLEGGPGLIDIVADRALDVGDCLIRTNVPNLTLLPAGRAHSLAAELFASERMEDIIQEIARRYSDRIVIFDSPPALMTSAASVLAGHAGQVVFVVAAEQTRESEVREGLALMSACPNVQLLLNRSRFFPAGRRFMAGEASV